MPFAQLLDMMQPLEGTIQVAWRKNEERGRERARAKAFFFCHARDFPSDIAEAGWPSGKDPGNKPSTLPLTGLCLNGFPSSTPWLCFVYS